MENQAINKSHWENVYDTKSPSEVSWTQEVPQTSLDFIKAFNLPKSASIIDIGGGDSKLVDYLIQEGYQNVTVLDISAKALEKTKERLGEKSAFVKWIVQDITVFEPAITFDIWHDRATFHFMTTEDQITKYLAIARNNVSTGGYVVLGTFSANGPEKCSGLPIKQYSEELLTQQLGNGFKKLKCITEDHTTPFNTTQNFLFCSFKKENRDTV
jgi:cyclopropane fatty-acyl-phospholipid synthase-like methyltransferase